MFQRCILFLMLSHYSNSENYEEMFNIGADDIIASEIGDIFEARKMLNSIPYNETGAKEWSDMKNVKHPKFNRYSNVKYVPTTHKIPVATIKPDVKAKIVENTLKDLKRRHMMRQLEKMLNENATVSDILINSNIDMLTRRFDAMLDRDKEKADTRREINYYGRDNMVLKRSQKDHTINLISHFVYITRYKLSYVQLVRKKYHHTHRYRIGFLFALLRQLKNNQKWLYSSITHFSDKIRSVYFELKIVDRLTRLDTDIKDVVLYLEKLEYWRNIEYNPKYYEYSLELYPSFGYKGSIPGLEELEDNRVGPS